MAITLSAVTIEGFDIAQPVGRGAPNLPDDLRTIKQMLNGVSSAEGGAGALPLDVDDVSTSGAEFQRLVEQIEIFQTQHFAGEFKADGVISPGKKTHRRLRDIFLASRDRRTAAVGPLPAFVRTASPSLFGASDDTGFSAEGLERDRRKGDWTRRRIPAQEVLAIGVGATRRFVVTELTRALDMALTVQSDDSSIVRIEDPGTDESTITLRAVGPGTTFVRFRVAEFEESVKVISRIGRTLTVNLTAVGPVMAEAELSGLLTQITRALTKIFQPQTNVSFTSGTTRMAREVRSPFVGQSIVVDPRRPLLIDSTDSLTSSPLGEQLIRARDLVALDPGPPEHVKLFVGNVADARNRSTIGKAFLGIGKRAAWFKLDEIGRTGKNSFATIAHEVGHSIGMFHITAVPSERFLMHDSSTKTDNNLIIPAETTVDLDGP